MDEPNCAREIIEVHEVFESHFSGTANDLSRVEAVLADDFTFVGPNAAPVDRAGVLAGLVGSQGQVPSLTIRTIDHQLVLTSGDVVVVEYIEQQTVEDRTDQRRSTVIFSLSRSAPNGLAWRRVHETWIPAD